MSQSLVGSLFAIRSTGPPQQPFFLFCTLARASDNGRFEIIRSQDIGRQAFHTACAVRRCQAEGLCTARRDALMLGALADAVPVARAHLRQLLSGWGRAGLSPDAGVVVSELVTNAVAASAGLRTAAPVLVWLGTDGYCLLLAVADVSLRPPVRLDVWPDAEGGRGLALVEALSGRWGWHPATITGLKKVVWAEWRLAEEETMQEPPVPDPGRSHDVSGLTT